MDCRRHGGARRTEGREVTPAIIILTAGMWTMADSHKPCPNVHAKGYVRREVMRFAQDMAMQRRIHAPATIDATTRIIESLTAFCDGLTESHPWQSHVLMASILLAWIGSLDGAPSFKRLHDAVEKVDYTLRGGMSDAQYLQACRWASAWLEDQESQETTAEQGVTV